MRWIRRVLAFALVVVGVATVATGAGRADGFAPDAYYRLRMDQ